MASFSYVAFRFDFHLKVFGVQLLTYFLFFFRPYFNRRWLFPALRCRRCCILPFVVRFVHADAVHRHITGLSLDYLGSSLIV
ncbi:hypothetical protein CCACVL1_03138 [Corchorus capsularis]|uniref:Uncharacterized protein n=1 Tax=Corchorus capsularis TaxID=210143 RepID=A0A1R3K2B7_COCAP|nr:hypothetical protein CCACVL1_03138 [Corchorus capsularis]